MVTFDGINKLIIMDYGVTSLDVRLLYATWKQWVMLSDNLKYLTAFEVVGGNPTIGDSSITPYFFLVNGWKVRPYEGNHTLKVEGILLSTDESDIFVDTIGIFRIGIQAIVPLYAETTEVNNASIVYSSFQNAVWCDTTSSYADKGSETHPNGNRERPVNSIQTAVLIAKERGFDTIKFIGNYSLGAGDDVTGFTLIGQNPTRTFLTLGEAAIITNVEIKECTVAGTIDGNATIRDCVIWDIAYFSGYIHHSVLTNSTIELGNNTQALFLHCYSGVPGSSMPTIDMGGSGQALGMRNYNGGIRLINRTGTDGVSLDMNAGQVVIDDTCNGDPVFIRGAYKLTVGDLATYPNTEGRVAENSTTATKSDLQNIECGGVLTQEQHNKLMESASKTDLIVASQL